MSLWTGNVKRAGVPVTIPGLKFTPREVEGFLEIAFTASFDKTAVPQPPPYDCGPYTIDIFRDGVPFKSVDLKNHFWLSTAWIDLSPVTQILHSPTDLVAQDLVPPFGDVGIPVVLPGPGSRMFPGPMTLTPGVSGHEGAGGGSPGRGIVTDVGAEYLMTGDARNMFEQAKCIATFPIWNWDESTGKLIDLVARPFVTSYGSQAQGGPPNWLGPWPVDITDKNYPATYDPNQVPQPAIPDTAHMADICGLAAMSSVAPRYVRGVQARVIKALDEDNYQVGAMGAVTVMYRLQMRATFCLLRELFFAYWATKAAEDAGNLPSDCLASSVFKTIIDNQVTQFNKHVLPSTVFQVLNVWYTQNAQIAWWQCDMLNQVLPLYAGKWPDEWGPIYIKTLGNLMARVNGDGKMQWPPAYPTWYWANVCSDPFPGSVPYAKYPTLWAEYTKAQIAGAEPSGNNGQINAATVAALAADPYNGGEFVPGQDREYLSFAFGALAYAVYRDRKGALAGQISAAYPNLEVAYSKFYAMMKKLGSLLVTCSISVAPLPIDAIPVPPPIDQPPVNPPPVDPPPVTPPPTGGTMTVIVQGTGYILTPKVSTPPGAVHYGVKKGSWVLDKADQATLAPQGETQATAKITANVDTTAEDLAVKCDVFVDAAKTKTLTISIVLSDVLAEATAGGFDVTPA